MQLCRSAAFETGAFGLVHDVDVVGGAAASCSWQAAISVTYKGTTAYCSANHAQTLQELRPVKCCGTKSMRAADCAIDAG